MIKPLEANFFDTIMGLPLHPLVDHAVVVLLPLSALALIAIVLVPRWRETYGVLTMIGLTLGTGSAFVAKESGEQLAGHVGLPKAHAEYADILVPLAMVLWLVSVVWFVMQRRTAARRASDASVKSTPALVAGGLSALLAVGVLGMTALVGHSGAKATWADQVTNAEPSESASTTDDAAPSTSASAPTAAAGSASASATSTEPVYTLAQVKQHSSTNSCWAAVKGNVYDLTKWIDQHPGGRGPITKMCGPDATTAFTNQHGTQRRPNNELDSFKIGVLKG